MHINSNDLNNFQNEEMNTDEIIAFLEHMNHCDYCLNQLVDEYTDHASSAPAYLKGTIMERVTAPDIQIQKTAADATYKMRFFYEGLRTVVGVVLALVMLFSLGQMDFVSPQLPQSTANHLKRAGKLELRYVISQMELQMESLMLPRKLSTTLILFQIQ